MTSLLFKNVILCNEGSIFHSDIRVKDNRIDKIAADITPQKNDHIIDGKGRYLLPGMIDDQVHFREPGMVHKAGIATESRAAAAGGITSFMDMPNTRPTTTSIAALEEKYKLASDRSLINYAFYLGATNDNIDEIRKLDKNQTCGIKVFMGASTGNMLVDRVKTLEQIFADAPVLVATHCEDTPTILQNTKNAEARFGKDIPIEQHPYIRSEEACYLSSSLAVELAKSYSTNLHVLHISTARELELFEPGPIAGKQITAEACVHFLHFSEEDYAEKGALIKCNPAIKTARDRQQIIQALSDGRLDILATDHAPHLLEEKAADYLQSPSGLPLVQRAMQVGLDRVIEKQLSLEKLVELTSHNPAIRYQIKDRGFIREGYFADLVLIDLEQPQEDRRENVLYTCGWSPFEGHIFHTSIAGTWVNGVQVWDGEAICQQQAVGKRLEYTR
ncbi:MAG: dihydroorotase [bacterium]